MNTLGVYSIDNLSMNDLLVDEFNDTGTDVLGASDSILGGCDTYTSVMSRLVDTSVDVSGNAGASPYLVEAFGWDQVNNTDTGSSTLATSTHVYATDSFTYVEDSGGTATATQTYGSSVNGWTNFGTASDSYVDNDQGVITISDTATTSHDSFGLNDTHSISGYESSATSAVSASSSWYDHGQDEDAFAASGSDSSTGDQYTFSDAESAQDNFAVTNQVVSAYNGVATDFSDSTVTMTGSTSTGPSASSFSYSQSNTNSESISDYGNVTDGGVVTPFSESQASSATYRYSVTGPPVTTAYQESIISSTLTGNTPYPANFTQTVVAGHADTAGSAVAHNAGSAPANQRRAPGDDTEQPGGLRRAGVGDGGLCGPLAVVRRSGGDGRGQLRRQFPGVAGSVLQLVADQLGIAPHGDRLSPPRPGQRRPAGQFRQRANHRQRHRRRQQRTRAGAAHEFRHRRQ